jgi:predicted PurR-regulated permease PerM
MSASASRAPRSVLSIAGDVLVFIAVLLLLYFAFLTTRPVLVAIVLAAALASLAIRPYEWMVRRLHGRRRLAALATVFLLLTGVLAPIAFVGTLVVQRLVVEGSELAHALERTGPMSVERIADRLGPLGPPFAHAADEIRPRLMAAGPQIASQLGAFVASVGHAAVRIGIGLFLVAVALYYFFLDGHRWRERVERLMPLPPEDTRMFFERFHSVCVAVLVGNLGTAATQALAATLGYFLFGVPVPLMWGAATLFAALIPLVGPALVWLPASAVVWLQLGWLRGVGLVLYGLLVVSTVDNVVRPLLTRRGMQLHPLLVFVAVLGGTLAFGLVGLFVGPLVIALVITVLEVYERNLVSERRARPVRR